MGRGDPSRARDGRAALRQGSRQHMSAAGALCCCGMWHVLRGCVRICAVRSVRLAVSCIHSRARARGRGTSARIAAGCNAQRVTSHLSLSISTLHSLSPRDGIIITVLPTSTSSSSAAPFPVLHLVIAP
eukprot:scaffold12292_cov112-Isochrysis_galbana.AAC.11